MRCAKPIHIRVPGDPRRFVDVPCNQCTGCRIHRRDCIAGRISLEHQSAVFGQFWTLTYAPEALQGHNGTAEQFRQEWRNFTQSVRRREASRGNPLPIRFYGCLELGSLSGRPHWHVLVWNALNCVLPTEPYRKHMPRPLYRIGPWRHGHVDSSSVGPTSARYVAKYVTKLNEDESEFVLPIYPRRPSLGLYGLRQHLESIARSPQRELTQQALVYAGGRTWPMAPSLKPYWRHWCNSLGLKCEAEPASYVLRQWERNQAAIEEQILYPAKWRHRIERAETLDRLYEWHTRARSQKIVTAMLKVARGTKESQPEQDKHYIGRAQYPTSQKHAHYRHPDQEEGLSAESHRSQVSPRQDRRQSATTDPQTTPTGFI